MIFLFPFSFQFLLEYFQLQNYQNMLHRKINSHYHLSQIKLSNEFLLVFNRQDLLHMPHSLF